MELNKFVRQVMFRSDQGRLQHLQAQYAAGQGTGSPGFYADRFFAMALLEKI